MSEIIPYGKQQIDDNDIQAVVEVLKADFLTQGPRIKEFEDNFAEYVKSKYAVAVSNGTAALHLSALSLKVNPGDKVITSPITFVASANCISYCGGEVVFADIDPETFLLDINKVRALLESAPKGTYQGIVPVDFAGRAVNMEEFRKLADEFDLWIIEDSCHAPGGYFIDSNGKKQFCGNGSFADLAIFSFHPVKHIASGEGGMITTARKELYDALMQLRTHGITRDKSIYINSAQEAAASDAASDFPGWYMEMQDLGYNYRITDIQAALGNSQLAKAHTGIARRREIAARYEAAFNNAEFVKRQSGVVEGHAYHLYILEVEDRLGLYNFLREQKVFAQIHYIPAHLMPYYKSKGWKAGDLPHAEEYYKNCISLPMYPSLTDDQQEKVIRYISEYYEQ